MKTITRLPATFDNSGHTATLRSAQIQPYGWTSYVRKTLSETLCSISDRFKFTTLNATPCLQHPKIQQNSPGQNI